MFDPDLVKRYHKYIENYDLHLVYINEMNDKQISSLNTDLKQVFQFIKSSDDKNKLSKLLETDSEKYSSLHEDSIMLINEITGSKLKFETEGGIVDVCEAIRQMREEAAEIATKKARDEAIKIAFDLFREQHPEDSVSSINKGLAKAYKRSQKSIKALVL